MLLPALAQAQSPWLSEPAVAQKLAAGEIVVRAEPDGQHVAAAVRIHAPAEVIWEVLIDCEGAPKYMPGLKSCRKLAVAPDGSWANVAREFKYSWVMPATHDVVHTEYHRPERIDFHRISGEFRDESGAWVISSAPEEGFMTLEYQFYIDLGFWLPHSLVLHSLRTELPAAMSAVRSRAESTAHSAH
jgi:uncharacterized membrane protein